MKILVIGSGGMLGASLLPFLSACGHEVAGHSRNGTAAVPPADLSVQADVNRMITQIRPDVVINLAALTDVDRCEAHPQEAWLANVLAVEHVAFAVKASGAHLVQISTDQLYDANHESREDEARPGNTYALSKYAGELAAAAAASTILRTNFFGASRHATRRSLTDWLFASISMGNPINVFDDVSFSPLSISTLCGLVENVAQRRLAGTYNLGSHGGMSKADFAFAFARSLDLPSGTMTRALARDATFLKAWRPSGMRMDSSRFEAGFGLELPHLVQEIERAAKDYRENN